MNTTFDVPSAIPFLLGACFATLAAKFKSQGM